MNCKSCRKQIPDESIYCLYCGKKQTTTPQKVHKRGNSTGSVYKLPNGKWRAVITLGYDVVDGKKKRRVKSKQGFSTKKEALDYLPILANGGESLDSKITFKELYDAWRPTHTAGKSTMACYAAACKHYKPLWYNKVVDIKTSALQACVSSQPGKRTQQNMKALATMLWREALKDDIVSKNYAQLIKVGGETQAPREPFTDEELKKLWACDAPNVDAVLIMCYTGFRIGELLALTDESFHDGEHPYFIGGGKTEAGRDRIVAVSPRIYPLVKARLGHGHLFTPTDPNNFRKYAYYPALEAAGVRALSPHSCRHTFATMLKKIDAPDADKLAFIGHTKMDMTLHYTHADVESAYRIAEKL